METANAKPKEELLDDQQQQQQTAAEKHNNNSANILLPSNSNSNNNDNTNNNNDSNNNTVLALIRQRLRLRNVQPLKKEVEDRRLLERERVSVGCVCVYVFFAPLKCQRGTD